jgi:hypothetical protein
MCGTRLQKSGMCGLLDWLSKSKLRMLTLATMEAYSRHHAAGCCYRFTLQAVRHNSTQHAYLNVGTMSDWQHCSPHPSDDALHDAAVACLRRLALAPAVARLASRHVINVFVSGSNRENYCNDGELVCQHELAGLAYADGPWWHRFAVSSHSSSTAVAAAAAAAAEGMCACCRLTTLTKHCCGMQAGPHSICQLLCVVHKDVTAGCVCSLCCAAGQGVA